MGTLFRIHENDNVAVAIGDIDEGQTLDVADVSVTAKAVIRQGHKMAILPIKTGDAVIKYGYAIGLATEDIPIGAWVHTHNLATSISNTLTYEYQPEWRKAEKREPQTFRGYRRKNGKAGVRNEIWIIPTVGCINGVAKRVEALAQAQRYSGIDGVYAFTHPFGCSQMGDDLANTQKILADLANHPNAAGVLVLGLGCENNLICKLKPLIDDTDVQRVKYLEIQNCGDELAESLELIETLASYAATFRREEMPTSELIVGLKCGGSDGYSGITANPLVGRYSDILTAEGGTTILTEVPEMFGAEHMLMARCEDKAVFDKCVAMINNFKQYFMDHHQVIYENPSPGNKEGGISTLEDKSLGCTQKSGSAVVRDVLDYADTVKTKGLNLLSAPGNDLVASTALAAAGAQIVLFTTGRGTPFGCPVPTVKISTNTSLFENKQNWIDLNAGELVFGLRMEQITDELYRYVLALASGEQYTKNEVAGYREISIFKDGVFL